MKNIVKVLFILLLLMIIPKFNALKYNENTLNNSKILKIEDIYEDTNNNVKLKDITILKNEYADNSYMISGYLYNDSDIVVDYSLTISLLETPSIYGVNYKLPINIRLNAHESNYIYKIVDTSFDVKYYNIKATLNSVGDINSFEYKKSIADYVIDSYDIDINVLEDNTFEITERISAFFNVYKHGIFRRIPLKNEVVRLDGTTSKNNANIFDISVNEKYSVTNENGYKVIKIGSPNYTIIGKKDYIIKYKYNIGKDPLKDMDELYYNLIGTEWDTAINNVTFKITMPKEFDETKLGFSNGKKGNTTNNVEYDVKGNVISGKLIGYLNGYEALTIRLELPEGYFVKPKFHLSLSDLVTIIISVVCASIALILWSLYGDDKSVIETIEFKPIDNLNPLDMALIYKGKCSKEDVSTLLLYLANKGYIKINENGRSIDNYSIEKIRDYDGNNKEEKMFMERLFSSKTKVTSSDLKYKFYRTVDKILKSVNDKNRKEKYFKNTKKPTKLAVMLLIINIMCMFIVPNIINGQDIGESLVILIIIAFYTPFYFVGIKSDMPIGVRIFWLGFTVLHSSVFFMSVVFTNMIVFDSSRIVSFIIGLIASAVIIICIKYMPNRTDEGLELYGRIKGFKKYLKTAEKPRLERMVFENPNYFYDILPYAYILSVSKIWMNKFNDILLTSPNWYDGNSSFTVRTFNTFISDTMKSATTTMNSTYSSSSSSSGGGGFSGGGSSGGGSGGGGGGSW